MNNKNIDIESLVRQNIRNLKPYRSARDDFDSGILLDANENSFGPPFEHPHDLHRYPMPYQEQLRDKIANYRNIQIDQVFVGVGSDEAIDLLFRIFCNPTKDRIIITPPTYGMYKVSAAINDVGVDEVLMSEDFQLRPKAILEAVSPQTKMIFVCSPNNPTGNRVNTLDVITLLEQFPGIVVVDEAYIDFSEEMSFVEVLDKYPNLVVLQTLSKAFGLAGIRLGIALASPVIIQYMMKVKAPYNINTLTSQAATKAFDHLESVKKHILLIRKERERVSSLLRSIKGVQKVYPSDANFLIFKIQDAYSVYQKLAKEGIIIRYRGNEPHCQNCLRLTIGTPMENDRFLESLKKVLNQ